MTPQIKLDGAADEFSRRDQSPLEIVDHVRNLLRRGIAHEDVQAERRRPALGGAGAYLTEEFDRKRAAAALLFDRETSTLKIAPIIRGTLDEARAGVRRPRDG